MWSHFAGPPQYPSVELTHNSLWKKLLSCRRPTQPLPKICRTLCSGWASFSYPSCPAPKAPWLKKSIWQKGKRCTKHIAPCAMDKKGKETGMPSLTPHPQILLLRPFKRNHTMSSGMKSTMVFPIRQWECGRWLCQTRRSRWSSRISEPLDSDSPHFHLETN